MGSKDGQNQTKRAAAELRVDISGHLSVYYANVDNSLLSKMDELKVLLSETSYDIIGLNEVKPKHGETPSPEALAIQGYDLFYSDFNKVDTRGVCIYVKEHLNACQVYPSNSHCFTDSVWVSITDSSNKDKCLIGCIYRSGTIATAKKYDPGLNQQLTWASTQSIYNSKVIFGDFNMPKIKWTPEPTLQVPEERSVSRTVSSEEVFIECIRDTFFHQHVHEDTRHRNGNCSALDLLFTNDASTIEQVVHLDPLGASDHSALNFKINMLCQTKSSSCFYKPMYSKGNYEKLREMLSIDWTEVLAGKDVQSAYDYFEDLLQKAIKECVPMKKISMTPKKNKPLWMTSSVKATLRTKKQLWSKYKQTRHRNDYNRYKNARNTASHELRKARKKFEKKLAKNLKRNTKSFWNYVNSSRKNKSKVNDLKDADGSFITENKDKANALNLQYAKTFTVEDESCFPTFPIKQLISYLEKIVIDENDVRKLLVDLNIDKSPGPDQLHPRILREVAEIIAKPVTLIFQLSIDQSKLPQQWKLANVSPIFKKGSRSQPENYRPVSLTSVLSKLLERIISKQILEHLKSNSILPKEQHGFLKGKSTSTNLLEAMNIWTELLEHKAPIDILYLDYAKAFDTVPHQRLIRKLKSIGIKGNLLAWLKDFLIGRKQRVVVNHEFSEWIDVLSGVPQGTVLGPLLFLIFVSEIPDIVESHSSLFADDTKLYSICSKNKLQSDLDKVVEWTNEMQMSFNAGKCKVMHLGKDNPLRQYTMLDLNNERCPLTDTETEKDLGVLIDNRLSFTDHVTAQVNKANRALGALRATYKYMDKYTFKHLYKSLIRPHVEYASPVWSVRTKYNQDLLERVQRRATKIIPEIKHLSYTERLKVLNLPTLLYRRRRADVLQLYKILHGFDDFDLDNVCEICGKPVFQRSLGRERMNTRGHCYKLQTHSCSTNRKLSFFGRVVPLWNKLKSQTVCCETVNDFKAKLAEEWSNQEDMYGYTFSY